ncbi:MAG: hypothetical protein JRL30_02755 [Deltaproteobacteria bacterium]|nr:hypothetical protein [Deltaproteobacteria bacterium]
MEIKIEGSSSDVKELEECPMGPVTGCWILDTGCGFLDLVCSTFIPTPGGHPDAAKESGCRVDLNFFERSMDR